MKPRFVLHVCLFLIASSFFSTLAYPQIREQHMQQRAHKIIADFRNGKSFVPDESVKELVHNQRMDQSVLNLMVKELAEGSSGVRENIVRLLEYAGLEMDSPAPDKIRVIRDKRIIKALLVEGFIKNDSAADAAAAILADKCRPDDLASFSNIYIESLKIKKGDYIFLVAKAKVTEAATLLENMAELPKWREHQVRSNALNIARAALGNRIIEDEFISRTYMAERQAPPAPKNRFYDTSDERDGKNVADQLYNLGLIGTRSSLAVACKFLRSPLKTYVPNHSERSIRYNALKAISYNYPDERILVRPRKYDDWVAVEQFCTNHIGVVFDGATPEFEPDRPYPIL